MKGKTLEQDKISDNYFSKITFQDDEEHSGQYREGIARTKKHYNEFELGFAIWTMSCEEELMRDQWVERDQEKSMMPAVEASYKIFRKRRAVKL